MKKVEQVDIDGNIFLDYDTSLSKKGLLYSISNAFPAIYIDEDGLICGKYKGKKYAIRAKNITYLGHPHPLHKKRIQIANDLQLFYKSATQKGYVPILLGVYTCGENTVFCDFNIDDYVGKKAHNSSAHVYTTDLANATVDGYFYKEDTFGNKITVFNSRAVNAVLEEKLNYGPTDQSKDDLMKDHQMHVLDTEENFQLDFDSEIGNIEMANDGFQYDMDFEISSIENVVMEFFSCTNLHWHGIECYKAMIAANYRNKYQPEWPGFFLEFTFENYLNSKGLTNIIQYAQDKTKGGIDLDLYFPRIDMYGDLKAHSSNSNAIQGNDWATIFNIINDPVKNNHIYYVVCEHDTCKDSDFEYEVTYFWNKAQGKANTMSYHKRMKNNVQLTHAYIFDINNNNKQHLTKFKQGLNSNGKPREPKIMIDHDNFKHFILAEKTL